MSGVIRAVAKRLLRRGRSASPTYETIDTRGWKTAPGFEPRQLKVLNPSVKSRHLDQPNTVELASSSFEADELAVGVSLGGRTRAYPLSVLDGHHVVNDQLGDHPLTMTFCISCFSAAAFDPVIDDVPLTFEATGLYGGNFVMSDDQTGTIWNPISGEALAGPWASRRLGWLSTQIVPVATWFDLHPDSSAIDPIHRVTERPVSAHLSELLTGMPGRARPEPKWLRTVPEVDRRIPPRSLVVGAVVDGIAKAFSLDGTGDLILYQDAVGDVPVVLIGARGAVPTVYDRRTQGGVVELRLDGGRIVDSTGSLWTVTGEATDGPMTGTRLQVIVSRLSEWHAWAFTYPSTEVVSLHPVR